jgi:hypothetical protein
MGGCGGKAPTFQQDGAQDGGVEDSGVEDGDCSSTVSKISATKMANAPTSLRVQPPN